MGLLPGSDSNHVKMKIQAYKFIDLSGPIGDPFILQTNPEKLSYSFKVDQGGGSGDDGKQEGMNATGASAPPPVFRGYFDMNLKFEFYADATGIVPIPDDIAQHFSTKPPSIKGYLDHLQNVVYAYEPESHGPPYLEVIWGELAPSSGNDNTEKKPAVFKCQLESYDVEILLFSISGDPVKAKITLNLKSLIDPDAKPLGNSPDVTHNVQINYGDKMTKICNEIYGRYDTKICSAVAEYNNLVSWRKIKPGTDMVFPSIHLLNEEYIKEWDEQEKKQKESDEGNVKTHFEHMADLIGEKKAKQYFKTFGFNPEQPYEEWQQERNKTKGYA